MSQPPAELAEHVQPSRGGNDDINSKYFDKTNGIKTVVLSSPVLGFYLLLTVGYFYTKLDQGKPTKVVAVVVREAAKKS